MAGLGVDVRVSLGNRPHEVDRDRLAHRRHAVAQHGQRGGARADALDQGRDDATVHQPDRLAQLLAHRDPHPSVLRIVIEPLRPDQRVEVRGESTWVVSHRRAPYGDRLPGLVPLSDDQRALLRLLAQREEGYGDIAALMGLSVDEVRSKVKGALAGLDEGEPGRGVLSRGGAPRPRRLRAEELRPAPPAAETAPPEPGSARATACTAVTRIRSTTGHEFAFEAAQGPAAALGDGRGRRCRALDRALRYRDHRYRRGRRPG